MTGMTVLDSRARRATGDLIAISLQYLVLPAVTLATIPLAMITRITRAEMLATARSTMSARRARKDCRSGR